MLCLLGVAAAPRAEELEIRDASGPWTRRAPMLQAGDVPFVAVAELAGLLGLDLAWDPTSNRVAFEFEGRRATLLPRVPYVLVGSEVVRLSRAPEYVRGQLAVPVDFVERVVGRLLERQVEREGSRFILTTEPWRGTAISPPPEPSPSATIGPQPTDLPRSVRPPGAATRTPTVVLDPGHGGRDQGAPGPSGLVEKEVALDLARRLKRILEGDGGIRVLLTRDEDRYVPLEERTGLANQEGDLLVSIHLNAGRRGRASGFEVYYMSLHASDPDAETLSQAENRALGIDDDRLRELSEDLRFILWDLVQTDCLAESARLAETVLEAMARGLDSENRGVRQAPLAVLMGSQVPAALVEVAFISNPEEESLLKSDEHRERIARAVGDGLLRYLEQYRAKYGDHP